MFSLGESLMTERKYEEALAVFLSSDPKHFDGAKQAAKACGDWRAYFSCCGESGESIDSDQVTSIAESISSKMLTPKEQKESFASAARISLDYGHDVAHAMDMFISGHMWFEGRRISYLHNRTDLAKKCIDAASSYASSCIEDLSERASTFEETNLKYSEVIVLRRDAIKEAEETGANDHHDDNASLFSMQSTASNSSLRSTASSSSIGSIGSVASVSTVISVGTNTGFQFTGDRDTTFKHKSKFNKLGREQKKKKKKKAGPAARRMKPGSEEHLKELVMTLTTTCPDDHYLSNISETISFLLQSGKHSLARCLFEAYHELETSVRKSQTARLESESIVRQEKERMARREGLIFESIEHPCEKEVNALYCKMLPPSIENIMSFLTT
jgi:elongator complex protein 1